MKNKNKNKKNKATSKIDETSQETTVEHPDYSEYAVVFDNVDFDYNQNQRTLKNVSFKIKKGDYVALIGHNGSGKSTIAKLIIGILAQLDGHIYINNIEMTDDSVTKLRKEIGIVFQNPDNQFIGNTVRDDIAFSLENMCVEPSKMEEIITEYASLVNMQDYLDEDPASLSGGQKQRVAIAGTLVKHPQILVLDEATAMLDPKGKRDIFDFIHRMKNENPDLTVISITHEIDEAYRADKVIVLNDGELYCEGTPKEVFSRSQELEKINLDIPFFNKLAIELHDLDKDLSNVTTIEELVKVLCQ